MVNYISNDAVGLYITWANTSLFVILSKLPTLNLPIKSHPSLRYLFFSDVVLVLNYQGWKWEAINLIPHYLVDVIHKTVKPCHLEKLQIIQSISKQMFQFIFITSDWILIKQIIVSSSSLLSSWGKQIFKNFNLEFWVENWGMIKNAWI